MRLHTLTDMHADWLAGGRPMAVTPIITDQMGVVLIGVAEPPPTPAPPPTQRLADGGAVTLAAVESSWRRWWRWGLAGIIIALAGAAIAGVAVRIAEALR
jgi:hypothetical protein